MTATACQQDVTDALNDAIRSLSLPKGRTERTFRRFEKLSDRVGDTFGSPVCLGKLRDPVADTGSTRRFLERLSVRMGRQSRSGAASTRRPPAALSLLLLVPGTRPRRQRKPTVPEPVAGTRRPAERRSDRHGVRMGTPPMSEALGGRGRFDESTTRSTVAVALSPGDATNPRTEAQRVRACRRHDAGPANVASARATTVWVGWRRRRGGRESATLTTPSLLNRVQGTQRPSSVWAPRSVSASGGWGSSAFSA